MNYIFDFDGTISDSFEFTLNVANEFLTKLKKKTVDAADFRENGIEEIIRDYKLNKLQILLYIFKGRREIRKHITELKTFAGMPDVIKKLSKTSTLGIVSSNSKKNIDKFLKLHDLDKYFKFIVSSPSLFKKSDKINSAIEKYDLNKNETIYVGDEIRDIDAARKVHIKCIAVTWGFSDASLLKKHKPDFLINKAQDLLNIC